MIKTAATQDQIKASMKQLIKASLESIKDVIADPNTSQTSKSAKIDDLINRLNSTLDTQIAALNATATPATATPTTPAAIPAAADDGANKVPAFWRRNLDYGSSK
jgi:hypothetical protein